jgi:23S rRNA (pseudouridine1915-N3)-methyltransferase
MIRFKFLSIGKVKESWLQEALDDYVKRLQPIAEVDFQWLRDDKQLIEAAVKESFFITLDSKGQQLTSEEFADFIQKLLMQQGPRLTWVIGGPTGLPANLRNHKPSVSLSKMTFTHQLARLVLIEQIYRGFEIARGSPYHK